MTSATPDTATFTERALAAASDRILHAARTMGRPSLRHDDLVVAWQGDRGFFTNIAYVLGEPASWDGVLSRIEATVPHGRPVSLVGAVATPDLADRGWQLVGHPPLMIRSAGGPPGPEPAELTITEVADEAGLEVFERTLVDAYPDPQQQPYRWGGLHDGRVLGGPTHFFTGWVAGRPVATATSHVAAGLNVVEMVATEETARGRGYGAALTWRASTTDPELPAALIASDLGRPVYECLGFVTVDRWTFWHRPA